MIKVNKIFPICAVGFLMLYGCSGGSKSRQDIKTFGEIEEEFASTLTQADTVQVLTMGEEILDSLSTGNVDWALETIHSVNADGEITPLSPAQRETLEKRFSTFPIKSYELDYYSFSVAMLNDLKYRTYIDEADADGSRGPALALMFNPVRKDDRWYICLKEESQPAKDAANAINPAQIIE